MSNTRNGKRASQTETCGNKNNRNTTRRRKNPSKGKANVGYPDKRQETKTEGMNDITWYSRNPELLAAAARIPFPYKPGMSINLGIQDVESNKIPILYDVPGVCALNFVYSIGQSTDISSPACIASREMYGRIRANYSGSLEADAPDIFMYAMALDQIHAYIAFMKRVYKTINLYSPYNRNYPETIMRALGFEPDHVAELQRQKTQLWGYINTLVNMANKFAVPDDMDIYKRHRWMNENIYLDAADAASQSFVFNPYGFYKVDTTGETGTALNYVSGFTGISRDTLSSGTLLADYMYNFGRSLIDALSTWDDSYTINGYIMRAYDNSAFLRADLLGQEEIIQPIFEPEVLIQIMNFTGVGYVDLNSLKITQDPASNIIIHVPKVAIGMTPTFYTGNPLLNIPSTMPTAAEVTIASRLQATVVSGTQEVHGATEIPMFTVMFNSGERAVGYSYNYVTHLDSADTWERISMTLKGIMDMRAYTGAPSTWLAITDSEGSEGNSMIFCGDVANITEITAEALRELTRVCIYSEFNCFMR